MDVVRNFLARYEHTREEELSLEEYLDLCKRDSMAYATAAERMLAAIGEPEVIDTRHDQRLSRIFGNKMVRIYPAFKDFYGLEEPIEQVVSCFRHAAQGLAGGIDLAPLAGHLVGLGKESFATHRDPSIARRLRVQGGRAAGLARRLPGGAGRKRVPAGFRTIPGSSGEQKGRGGGSGRQEGVEVPMIGACRKALTYSGRV